MAKGYDHKLEFVFLNCLQGLYYPNILGYQFLVENLYHGCPYALVQQQAEGAGPVVGVVPDRVVVGQVQALNVNLAQVVA